MSTLPSQYGVRQMPRGVLLAREPLRRGRAPQSLLLVSTIILLVSTMIILVSTIILLVRTIIFPVSTITQLGTRAIFLHPGARTLNSVCSFTARSAAAAPRGPCEGAGCRVQGAGCRVQGAPLSGRGAANAEDAQGTLTQSHTSPSMLVYED